MKKWKILYKLRSKNEERITNNEIIQILLNNRGIKTAKDIDIFLHPNLDRVTIKSLNLDKKQLDKSVQRIKTAIKNKESIVVYTDYDADGICSGAVIWETLYNIGAKVMPYVPHRIKEGYGLSKIGIDQVIKNLRPKLIITVDHGISALEQIDYINKLGIDTIILDHHVKAAKIPQAYSIVHTTKLCASGIAWFFSQYLVEKLKIKSKEERNYLDLAGIGTIADLVQLKDGNRAIVKFGLEELNKSKRPGLNSLIKESGMIDNMISVYEVGHIIAPRINALGRITHAMDALRLLCTRDKERAKQLAKILSTVNQDRQNLTAESTVTALNIVKKLLNDGGNILTDKLLFISHESFHQGVIGLIAGKLVEEYYRPTIVVSIGKEYSKASARSIAGFNIVEHIRRAAHLLRDVGGHPMAAGFTVETGKLRQLEEFLTSTANKEINSEILEKFIKVDMELPFDQISPDLYQSLSKLSPFGAGNPEPVFVSRNVDVLGANLVGKNKNHLKLKLRQEGSTGTKIINAIGFNLGEIYPQLKPGSPVDLVYSITRDDWNGGDNLQLKLKDVNLSDNGFSSSQ